MNSSAGIQSPSDALSRSRMRRLSTAAIFAGGLAPMIMTTLIATTGTSLSVSAYILAMAVVTWIAVCTIRERFQANSYETSADIRTRTGKEAQLV